MVAGEESRQRGPAGRLQERVARATSNAASRHPHTRWGRLAMGTPENPSYSLTGLEKCIWTILHLPSRFSSTPVHRVLIQEAGWPFHSLMSSSMQ
jgi:hypothetical protein